MLEVIKNEDFFQIKILEPVSGNFKQDVDMIKAIPGRFYRDGYWYISFDHKYSLIDLFGESNIIWVGEEVSKKEEYIAPMLKLDHIIDKIDLNQFKLPPFPYQIVGASFLIAKQKAILADEPGVGKTLQAIIGVNYLMNQGLVTRALVVSPSSVKYQWAREIEKFTNHTSVVIDGVPKKRKQQMETNADFYLINYELVRQEFDLAILKEMDFDIIILDEAHRIKDHANVSSTKIRELDATYKWLLTGTPIQNKLEELFSLFLFMDESVFGRYATFKRDHLVLGRKYGRYGVILGYKDIAKFRQKSNPYMMRRTLKEVLPQMPPLTITNFPIELTKDQYRVHDQLTNDMYEHWKLLKTITDNQARQVAEDQLLGYQVLMQEVTGSLELLNLSKSQMAKKYAIPNIRSPKLEALEEILVERLANDPELKIIIFSQFERMQGLVVKQIGYLGNHTLLNGSMKAYLKQASIDKFKYDPDIRFLICTDSANTGLNLQEASLLINIDIPWNPAILTQRMGRIRRADSKHELLQVINLIAIDSIDERILETNYDKIELSNYLVEKTEADKKVVAYLTEKTMKKMKRRH